MTTVTHYGDLARDDNSGTITVEGINETKCENISSYSRLIIERWFDFYESETVNIGNLPWKLKVRRTKGDFKRLVSVRMYCNEKCASTIWSCDATIEYRLLQKTLHSDSEVVSTLKIDSFHYNYNNTTTKAFQDFDMTSAHLKDIGDTVSFTVVADVSVKNIVGIRKRKRFQFGELSDNLSDVALIVEGKKLCANKNMLGMYSPVFHAMFFSGFKEQNKSEIELKNVGYDDFVELLNIIYPTQTDVREKTFEKMLELADRFEIESVVDKCEKFLIADNKIKKSKKLLVAQNYKLSALLNACVQSFASIDEMQLMRTDESYKQLNFDTKTALLERLIKMHESR